MSLSAPTLDLPSSLRIRNCLFRDVTKDTSPILLSRQGDVQWPPCEHKRAHRSALGLFSRQFFKRQRLQTTPPACNSARGRSRDIPLDLLRPRN